MENLPLSTFWERAATKELTQIAYGVASGGFDSPQDLASRLSDVATWLNESYGNSRISDTPAPAIEWLNEQFLGGL